MKKTSSLFLALLLISPTVSQSFFTFKTDEEIRREAIERIAEQRAREEQIRIKAEEQSLREEYARKNAEVLRLIGYTIYGACYCVYATTKFVGSMAIWPKDTCHELMDGKKDKVIGCIGAVIATSVAISALISASNR